MIEANIGRKVDSRDENIGGLAYQSYYWCNVNDFSLFKIIQIITCIYSYTLTMTPQVKKSNLSIFSSQIPLRGKPVKLH